jgi:hypothetical protein
MIVSFEENGKKYEVQNEHVDEIFEKVKTDIQKIFDQYQDSGKDVLIALIAAGSVTKSLMQFASNEYGVNDIIETVGGIEIV